MDTRTRRCLLSYDRFERIITDKGITCYRVAEMTGIRKSLFSDWKSGRAMPKFDKISKIAKALEVDVTAIYGEEF